MKKNFTLGLLFALLLGVNLSAFSQEQKDVVLIDFFNRAAGVDQGHVENLRTHIIQGITETERLRVLDVATQPSLATEEQRRKAESAMSDVIAHSSAIQTLGAKYIITADVTTMTATKKTTQEGAVYYTGNLTWAIKAIDASNGVLKYTETYQLGGGNLLSLTGSGSTPDDAMLETCKLAKKSMKAFVNKAFPIEGTLLKVETVKKNKAETVYIDLGSAHGVSVGQRFDVYVEIDIAGEVSRKAVGELNAKEVLSASRALCKVTKGGDLILDASNKEQKLIVVSRAAKLLEF